MVHEVLPKLEAQVGSAPVLAIARALTPAFQQALLEGAVDLVGSVSGSCPGGQGEVPAPGPVSR